MAKIRHLGTQGRIRTRNSKQKFKENINTLHTLYTRGYSALVSCPVNKSTGINMRRHGKQDFHDKGHLIEVDFREEEDRNRRGKW